ncbi:unnamed protein product [Pleuronectes platessa]|uniref:Uncharacterized protein n=1 Tax=Pleuronectes platessa TaxID=8262 RepID=A0A9N7YAD7_PLEPL|nr:unnamed protein product [Pleuronectes platessa]
MVPRDLNRAFGAGSSPDLCFQLHPSMSKHLQESGTSRNCIMSRISQEQRPHYQPEMCSSILLLLGTDKGTAQRVSQPPPPPLTPERLTFIGFFAFSTLGNKTDAQPSLAPMGCAAEREFLSPSANALSPSSSEVSTLEIMSWLVLDSSCFQRRPTLTSAQSDDLRARNAPRTPSPLWNAPEQQGSAVKCTPLTVQDP